MGTEENPFPAEYTAKIILHGHMLSKELPIYGSKVLALREGVLDLHGQCRTVVRHVCTCAHTHTCRQACTSAHMHARVCTDTHTHTEASMHTHTH